MSVAVRCAVLAVLALSLAPLAARADIARAVPVTIPLTELAYRDGVALAGASPRVTFDLPRYESLRAATLLLHLRIARDASPAGTIAVAVNGRVVVRRRVGELGRDVRMAVPLPLPPPGAQRLDVTVSGALGAAGSACADDSADRLPLLVEPDSAFAMQTAPGGTTEAFFRDYRGAIDVVGPPDDPALVAVPYGIDQLESWHRVDATLVSRPRPGRRTLVLVPAGPTRRRGDVVQMSFAAFDTLVRSRARAPERIPGRIAFGALGQDLGTAAGTGELAFDVPLSAGIVGGVPGGLHVDAAVAHSALPPGESGTIQLLVNGVLVGARTLDPAAATQTIDAAVPAALVGPSNDARIVVAPAVSAAACAAGRRTISATLLPSSTFRWSGIEPRPPTIESLLTALHGHVAVLVAPPFARAAFHFVDELGRMNGGIARIDAAPFTGTVPAGYDAAIVFAPPQMLAHLHLPIRPREASFAVIDPTAAATVLQAGPTTTFALLEAGGTRAVPMLAVSYHGAPQAIDRIATVGAAQLATQVAGVTVLDARGATAYDIGDKLRVHYPDSDTLAHLWDRARLWVALVATIAVLAGAFYCSRRLTGGTV
jgi:hypothetical protein